MDENDLDLEAVEFMEKRSQIPELLNREQYEYFCTEWNIDPIRKHTPLNVCAAFSIKDAEGAPDNFRVRNLVFCLFWIAFRIVFSTPIRKFGDVFKKVSGSNLLLLDIFRREA